MGSYKCCVFFTSRFVLEDVRTLFSGFTGGAPYNGVDELCRYFAAIGESDGDGDGKIDRAVQILDQVLHGHSHHPRFGKLVEELNLPIRQSKVTQYGELGAYTASL